MMKIFKGAAIGFGLVVAFLLISLRFPPQPINSFWDISLLGAAWWLIDHTIAFFL